MGKIGNCTKQSRKTRADRLNQLIKIKIRNPNITHRDLVLYIQDTWGVTLSCACTYIREINEQLTAVEDKDFLLQRGIIIRQLDDLYKKAWKENNLSVCASCLKSKMQIYGIEKYDVVNVLNIIKNEKRQNTEVNNITNIQVSNDEEKEKILQILIEAGAFTKEIEGLLNSETDKVYST